MAKFNYNRPLDLGAKVEASELIKAYKDGGLDKARMLYESIGMSKYNADMRLIKLARKGLVEYKNFNNSKNEESGLTARQVLAMRFV